MLRKILKIILEYKGDEMLKYTVKCTKSIDRMDDEELLLTLLSLRGVDNPEALLRIDRGQDTCEHDSMLFRNMREGLELFKGHLESGSPIHLLVDVDCFPGDTNIKMLDGTIKTFEELYQSQDEDNWVYSCDGEGNIKPGRVLGVMIKGETTEMCKVTFDNDKSIICTPDHLIMMRDGSYKEARELVSGESVIGFKEFVECSKTYNHKVKSVEFITYDEPIKLYDMEVEEWHNFAVDLGDNSGVFVHNCDGLTSSSALYQWVRYYYPNIKLTFDTNEGKRHGITREIIERIPEDVTLLITPDSSSSDVKEHIELWEEGIDILVLDHHEFDKEERTPAVIINCMDGEYPNTSLTGATVVYKFLKEYEYSFLPESKRGYIEKLLPVVALGTVADLADIRELETRYLCLEGFKDFGEDNLFLKAIMEEQEYSMKGVANFVTVGWYVAPLINAIFREGSLEDRYDLFKAISNFKEERTYYPQRKTKDNPDKLPVVESIQKNIIRRAKSIKSKQDSEVKKEVKELTKLIEDECPPEDNPVIVIDITGKVNQGHSGLIANKLASTYMRPVLLVNDKGGSARNYSKFPIDDLNEWITKSGLVGAHGHGNAFGLSFPEDKSDNVVQQIRDWTKEQLDGVDTSPVWHVDFEFNMAKLKPRHVLKVGQVDGTWGGKGMESPLFAITNIELETADVQCYGASGTFMKFDVIQGEDKITFVRPFTSKDIYKDFICEETKQTRGINTSGSAGNKKITATIIGKFKVNEFNGKQFPEVEIVAFDTNVSASRGRSRRGF